jgi:hypothetical protein
MDRVHIQKAKIDGQILELAVDIAVLPAWKQEIIRDMVGIINDIDVDQDDKDSANDTLAEVFMLFEKVK